MQMKGLKKVFLCAVILLLAGCSKSQEPADQIRVGTIAGPETQLMQVAKNVALQKFGLHVKIIQFTDYTMPNRALADGSIDANMFQHVPYLAACMSQHHYQFSAIGKTFVYPMGLYSSKLNTLKELKPGAIVAVPNDPTNEARALLLLQKAGLITLEPNVTIMATVEDIASNPMHLKIKELDAAQIPRVLPDVDLAAINTNYAIEAGLHPEINANVSRHDDALFLEGTDSLYANVIVVRTKDKNDPKLQELVQAFQSPQVLQAAQQIFHGDAIKAW